MCEGRAGVELEAVDGEGRGSKCEALDARVGVDDAEIYGQRKGMVKHAIVVEFVSGSYENWEIDPRFPEMYLKMNSVDSLVKI